MDQRSALHHALKRKETGPENLSISISKNVDCSNQGRNIVFIVIIIQFDRMYRECDKELGPYAHMAI